MRGNFLQPSDGVVRKKAAGQLVLIASCALTDDKHFDELPVLAVIVLLPHRR